MLIVVTALQLLGLGQSGVGALTAAVGVGGVVGGALVFVRLRSGRHGADLALGLLLWGIPLVLLSLLSSQAAAFFLLAVVGIGVTVVDVASVTLLQRTARGDLLPHALGVLQTVFVASVAAGTLIAPVLVSTFGIRGALLCTGAILPVLSIALWSRLRRLDERPPANPALVALLAAIPIFAPLSEAVLEHLASALEPLEFTAGTTVFSEGDHGDGFYVIERRRGGCADRRPRVIRTLGPRRVVRRDRTAARRPAHGDHRDPNRHAAASARPGPLHRYGRWRSGELERGGRGCRRPPRHAHAMGSRRGKPGLAS